MQSTGSASSLSQLLRLLFLLLLSWLAVPVSELRAAPARPLELGLEESSRLIGHFAGFRDTSAAMTFPEVLAEAHAGSFVPLKGNLNAGYTRQAHWARFSLLRREGFPEIGWLELGPTNLDTVDLYVQLPGKDPRQASSYSFTRLGDHLHPRAREVFHPGFVLPIELPPDAPIEVFVRIASSSSVALSGKVHTGNALRKEKAATIFSQSLYAGFGLTIVLILSLFAYLSRDALFRLFATYVLATMVYDLSLEGMLFLFLPPDVPVSPNLMLSLGLGAKIFLYLEFWRRYFIGSAPPFLLHSLRGLSMIGPLIIVAYFLGLHTSFMAIVSPLLIIGLLVVGLRLFWFSSTELHGNPLITLALGMSNLFYMISILRYSGLVPVGLFGDIKPAQMASVVDMAVITLAIAVRWWRAEQTAFERATAAESKAVGIAREMTRALRQNKERLEVALEAEQVILERKELFLAMLSHEYRTPLAVIEGNLDLMQLERSDGRDDDEMSRIRQSVCRLKELMEGSLERSRLMEQDYGELISEVPIEAFVKSQVGDVRWIWPNVDFSFECRCSGAFVSGDAQLLGALMFNLLDNARKYRTPGTPVRVSCGVEGMQARIIVSNRTEQQPDFDDSVLFEKYRRGENSRSIPGSGIGLWLVRKIIEQHGGTAAFTFDGVETVAVSITLPLSDGQPCR